jgi:hypothetical protein
MTHWEYFVFTPEREVTVQGLKDLLGEWQDNGWEYCGAWGDKAFILKRDLARNTEIKDVEYIRMPKAQFDKLIADLSTVINTQTEQLHTLVNVVTKLEKDRM